jgi:hypothetical protein
LDLNLGLRQLALSRSGEIPPAIGMPMEGMPCQLFRSPHASNRRLGYAIVAALTLAASLLLQLVWRVEPLAARRSPLTGGETTECVATLLFADHCRWASHSGTPLEGQRFPRKSLHLEKGFAVVRFEGGAAAIMDGEVEIDLESRGSVRVRRGRITVRADEEARGFTVYTPGNDVVDLGTEFCVDVDRNGATELHVLEGAVEYRNRNAQSNAGCLLQGGEAVRFDNTQATEAQPIAFKAKRFDELLHQANPRPREDRLLAYEGFDYAVGEMPISAANGGQGWAGPWRLRHEREMDLRQPDAFPGMLIALQKLTVPWPIRGGRAGMLEMPPGGCYRLRTSSGSFSLTAAPR